MIFEDIPKTNRNSGFIRPFFIEVYSTRIVFYFLTRIAIGF